MNPSAQQIALWRERPIRMAVEEFKFIPDAWQAEALEVFPSQDWNKLRISLQACAGPGKTALLAILNLIFIGCFGEKDLHPKAMCVSITGENLFSSLWPELAVWQARSEYMKNAFVWTKEKFFCKEFPAAWWIQARTWSKKADKASLGRTLSGLHAAYVMATLDESGDIPVEVLQSAEQILTSSFKWAKVLMAGNPTSHLGALYHAAVKAAKLWHIIRINGDPDNPLCSPRVNKVSNAEQIKLYGRDNPWVMAMILGQFPPESINALLSYEEVRAAMDRVVHPEMYSHMQKRIGVDVARFGDDRSSIFARQGLHSFGRPAMMRKLDSVAIAARVMVAIERFAKGDPMDSVLCLIDDTGHWGHGVYDILNNSGYNTLPLTYHAPAANRRYANVTTEMHFRGAHWIKHGGQLPDDPELLEELISRTYTLRAGAIALEDKGIAKARLGRSPDKSDAFMNTHAIPDMPKMKRLSGNKSRQEADFDPFSHFSDQQSEYGDFDPTRDEI